MRMCIAITAYKHIANCKHYVSASISIYSVQSDTLPHWLITWPVHHVFDAV